MTSPIRTTWWTEGPQWLVLLAMFALAGWTWSTAPERVPVHWNADLRMHLISRALFRHISGLYSVKEKDLSDGLHLVGILLTLQLLMNWSVICFQKIKACNAG